MLLFWAVVCVGAALLVGFLAGRAHPADYRIKVLREHAKYLRSARRASMLGKQGLANIYAEAAERTMNKLEVPKQ